MDNARLLECLASDFARLRAVVEIDQAARVPSCPDWTVADLTRHVGQVYLHKVACIREGIEPRPWPPQELATEEPLALLDRSYAELRHELTTRDPRDPTGGWYAPDQTVGFWIRRMAQETVIHRIDAELGTRQAVAPVPADLAVDGIDELLKIFLAYSVATWTDAFAEILAASPGRMCTVRADGAAWRVVSGPGRVSVEDGTGDIAPDLRVSGSPTAVLRWLWNREAAGEPSGVTVEGSAEALTELRRCLVVATQ
jgi:uncharacterized protein (TIGR03083 family)